MARAIRFDTVAEYKKKNKMPDWLLDMLESTLEDSKGHFFISGMGEDVGDAGSDGQSLPGGYLLVTKEDNPDVRKYFVYVWDGDASICKVFKTTEDRDACFESIRNRSDGVTFKELFQQRLFEYG